MNRSLITLFAFTMAFSACKQTPASLWSTPDAYLGQAPPADTPKIFAPGMLAEKGAWAGDRIAFSADGKEFYYSHNTSWFDSKNLKVKYVKFEDGKWSAPKVLTSRYYAPTFSPDDKTMYFIGGAGEKQGRSIVWQSHRTDTGWSPQTEYMNKPYRLYDFTPTTSGNIYAGSNGTWGNMDWKNCQFTRINVAKGDTGIKTLGMPLNSSGFNGDFFVAKDESYMIISYKEQPDFECELAISFHKPDDSWTNPKNLGALINNDKAHRWGEYVSPDGKYLFYTHGHSEKDCYIYWVRFDTLMEKLKHTNFEPYVKNPMKEQTSAVGKPFTLQIPDDTFVDDDGNNTLTYTVQNLPAGLIFDAKTKTITGKPVAGNYDVTVTATDAANAAATNKFTLKVK
jgi:hypothetical protein